jgi:NADH:ubiquinone oxidoreductase subunit F (NADH-binding)
MLGSGGFIVYNDTSCIVRIWNFARFSSWNAGQCSQEGTGWLKVPYVSKTVTDVKKILIYFEVKLKETRFVH